jgi:hypothetical protein
MAMELDSAGRARDEASEYDSPPTPVEALADALPDD